MNDNKKKLKNLLQYYFKKKITIIDAGVNKGHFLTKKIGLANIDKALMIDPIKNRSLKKLINKKFKYLDVALGNKKRETSFYIHSNKHSEWSSLHKISKVSPYNTLYKKHLIKPIKKKIYQESLDNILGKNTDIKDYFKLNKRKIDILKIDCQSNTLPILHGAQKTLNTKKIKMIIAAINPYDFYQNKKDDFIKILQYLSSKNFELINIANAHNGKLGNLNYSFSDFRIWTFDAIFINKKNNK
ncbi:FkbM family methyltransferase [Candidatus Pelagibacter sp.]|jgi:FkbM family methyltransferase|nr:FkbM family methyltransferase [Candidatus Pelagibacter sp.]